MQRVEVKMFVIPAKAGIQKKENLDSASSAE
jgi:hypothetical protein